MLVLLNVQEMAYAQLYSPCQEIEQLVETITTGPVSECLVEASPADINEVKSLIYPKTPALNIQGIKTVKNSFLEAMYKLKRDEMMARYGHVSELLLIHATSAANVESIVKDNFNWRKVKRGKFGHGTSFTDDAQYADQYANSKIGRDRAFIITKVLFFACEKVSACKKQILLPTFVDSTISKNKKVYVKFCDNEMLPTYVVYYNRIKRKRSKTAKQTLVKQ